MKKYIIITAIIFLNISVSYGKFMIVDIPPTCLLNGVTIDETSYAQSDTSTWRIPVLHDGTCTKTPVLSVKNQDMIFAVVDSFFENHKMYKIVDRDLYSDRGWNYRRLNEKGQDFINKILFPRIEEKITKELEKKSPNLKNIALYYYIVSTIGYDYHIEQPPSISE